MEDPPKHDNKLENTRKTTINIGAGAGSFGIGGIVLVGGALVTATLVSAAFAFKKRRQKQSRSSKETQPSDGVASTKEMESKTIHDSSLDEKLNCGMNNDIQVNRGSSNKDEESTSIYVDSVIESEQVDDSYEKIVVDSEERVVTGAHMELGFPSNKEDTCSKKRDGGDEEQKYSMLINNEKVESKSLVSYEAVTSIKCEYEASKVVVEVEEIVQNEKGGEAVQDEVLLKDEEIPNGHVGEDQDIVFTNKEAACLNLVKVDQQKEKDGLDEMVQEDCLMDETACVDQIEVKDGLSVQIFEEKEVIKAACDDIVDILETHENELHQTSCLENQPTQFMNEEETSQKVELMTIPDVQVIDDQPVDRPPTQSMKNEEKSDETEITKDDLVIEDEHSHVQLINEDREAKDVTVNSQVTSEVTEESTREEPTPELIIVNKKIEENIEENKTTLGKVQDGVDQNGIEKEDKGNKSAATFIMKLTKGKQAIAKEPWNLKVRTWSVLVLIWCICHWYSELPFPEISLLCSLMFILILLGYRNRTTHLVKYE